MAWYDYTNQAWVVDGVYTDCAHYNLTCGCYGRSHEGETPTPEIIAEYRES